VGLKIREIADCALFNLGGPNDNTFYSSFHSIKGYVDLMIELTRGLRRQVSDTPGQIWSSPLLHALYTVACVQTPRDRGEIVLLDPTKFSALFLRLLWSKMWITEESVWGNASVLGGLMSDAILDPNSRYSPQDTILSVKEYKAASKSIGEEELRVFFSVAITDPTPHDSKLLFFSSLAVKLCQQSETSLLRIFSIVIRWSSAYEYHLDKYWPFYIIPLLRGLFSSRTADPGQGEDEAAGVPAHSGDLDVFVRQIMTFWANISTPKPWGAPISKDLSNCGIVTVLSSLVALPAAQAQQSASRIVREMDVGIWRGAFAYVDQHREY
jgi:hypothetical protein